MSGTIDTMSLDDARRDSVSDQSRLTSFGTDEQDTTYVGIVRSDNERYRDVVDENEPRLAPPEELFYQWYTTRNELLENGTLETNAHNEALDRVNYFERFEKHLNGQAAQEAITKLVERVRSGEDVVLVCYCDDGKQCHRHPVAERIRARL